MRLSFAFLFFIFFTLTFVNLASVDPNYSFADYVRQFGKVYSQEEYPRRQAIFNANFKKLMDKQKEASSTYSVNVNKFTDWTDDEKKGYSTYKPQQAKLAFTPKPLRSLGAEAVVLPPVDYRALGKVTPPKDQGQCGSCWTFSTAGLYQSLFLITQQTNYDLSEQFVLQCSGAGSCDGGVPKDALDNITKTGIPIETTYPYTQSYTTASKCTNSTLKKLTRAVKSINHYYSLTDQELKQMLTDNGPIAVGVSAGNSAFMDYSSGVFNGCPQGAGIDHAVLLVGFTAEGHWIVKNSWGLDWGDGGYIIISKDNDCGLKTYVDVVVLEPATAPAPAPTPTPVVDTVNYTVTLTDAFGDGWNGNVLGISQQGSIVAIFGSKFTTGSTYGPVILPVKKGIQASVVVSVFASWTSEIGFTIKDDLGKIVYTRTPQTYTADYIFKVFCPYCSVSTTADIYITLTDSYGDGWQGNSLAARQDTTYYQFGVGFTTGHEYNKIVKITLRTGVNIDIVPYVLGNYREEMGFVVRDQYGVKLAERLPGVKFFATDVLARFCIGCVNSLKVQMYSPEEDQKAQEALKQKLLAADSTDSKQATIDSAQPQPDHEQIKGQSAMIISALSILVLVLALILVISFLALYRLWRRVKQHGEEQQINMTRSHVTQSNFPDARQAVQSDVKHMKQEVIIN